VRIRAIAMVAASLLLTGAVQAQAQVGRGPPGDRLVLERQIFQRFSQQVGQELRLEAGARGRLEQILLEGSARRRERAREAMELRRTIVEAMRDPQTDDAQFERMFSSLRELRQRENQDWEREEADLARILTPRQRALVILRLAQLQERVREMIMERPGPRGSGPPR
jgi:Spy/CpxP family protein refolding chaperone